MTSQEMTRWFHLRARISGGLLAAAVALSAQTPSPTFSKDVLPILQKNCQTCHRPGEIGPMPLLTYEQTRPWAKSIKSNVLEHKMPPWFADPKFGHFSNDRRLSDAAIHTLAAWVDAGAPEGDPKQAPPAPKWREGWNIQPDVILQMPDPYKVPKNETLSYVYVVLPTGFTKDTWVTAAEVRPGNRSVVHHILAVVRGSARRRDSGRDSLFRSPAASSQHEL